MNKGEICLFKLEILLRKKEKRDFLDQSLNECLKQMIRDQLILSFIAFSRLFSCKMVLFLIFLFNDNREKIQDFE